MRPTLSYLVCATPRSGSTLLCHLLDQTGIAGHPEEYFEALRHSGLPRRPHEYFDADHHDIVERLAYREMLDRPPTPNPLWRPESYERYLDWALERGTTGNRVFGAKLMWGYLGDFADLLRGIGGLARLPIPELLERVFPGLRYIRITRRDKVRQAVSLWKAVQTQDWRHERSRRGGGPPAPPEFSFRAINFLVRQLSAHDAAWDAYFTGLGIEPLTLTYEELAEANEPVLTRTLDYLGLSAPGALSHATPRLEIQADELSEQWVERYNAHLVGG